MPHFVRVDFADKHFSFALLHGNCNALNQPLVVFVLHLQTVNHDLNAVIPVSVELHVRHNLLHLAINTYVDVPLATNRLEEFLVVSLAVLDEWSKQDDAFAKIFVQKQIDNLLLCIAHHLLAANVRKGFGCPCV